MVKDDGLAAGKGVVVTDDRAAALAHAAACLEVPQGVVVVEEYLDGPEVSLFCLCDGEDVVALQPAQDFKRLRDGGQGPNTGGMGAYAPLEWLPEGFVEDVLDSVTRPVLREMAGRGTPFTGVLYVGLALTAEGPRVVEFNVRLGDPEAQVVLSRLGAPLSQLLLAAAQGRLAEHVEVSGGLHESGAAVAVVVAAARLPGRTRAPATPCSASTRPPRSPARTSCTPGRRSATGTWSPRAGGSSPSWGPAPTWPPPARSPTRPSSTSTSRAASSAWTSPRAGRRGRPGRRRARPGRTGGQRGSPTPATSRSCGGPGAIPPAQPGRQARTNAARSADCRTRDSSCRYIMWPLA